MRRVSLKVSYVSLYVLQQYLNSRLSFQDFDPDFKTSCWERKITQRQRRGKGVMAAAKNSNPPGKNNVF